ncbi:MAG TPA: DUF3551 domain-containing protein [Croceibacterium sp.]|nr:DUF3551 domain-containing protein [Croceibacterium sp.]
MRKWLLTVATLGFSAVALGAVGTTPASAGSFCTTNKDGGGTADCTYYSYRSCKRATSGIGGECIRNPYWNEQYGYMGPADRFGSSYNYYEGPVYGPARAY